MAGRSNQLFLGFEIPLMGLSGIGPLTSRLSGARSNRLSYRPKIHLMTQIKNRTLNIACTKKDICDRPKNCLSTAPDKLLRKEVIQPQLPLRLPCYDLAPVTGFTFGPYGTSSTPGFHGLTGGVYKARERIHRDLLIRDY